MKAIPIMGYSCIRIERQRSGFEVTVPDPEIEKKNRKTSPSMPWEDPNISYNFDTKAAVMAFLDKAIDIALPEDAYTSTFDKLAKEAGGTPDDGPDEEDD